MDGRNWRDEAATHYAALERGEMEDATEFAQRIALAQTAAMLNIADRLDSLEQTLAKYFGE